MAINYAKIAHSETPFSVMITVTGTDQETVPVTIPKATLIGYLAEGPLKAYLSKLSDAAWASLNIEGPLGHKIRIYEVAGTIADATEERTGPLRFQWVAVPGLSVFVAAGVEARTARRTIEIRYNHSTQG